MSVKVYRFGCGRYLQGTDAIEKCGEEAVKLHGSHAAIIGGHTAFSVAIDKITASLRSAGVSYTLKEHQSSCCMSCVREYCDLIRQNKCDLVIGVGGGKIMDLAKAVASEADLPVMNIPTSAATCAACTPHSIMYTEGGKIIPGNLDNQNEVNAVIVDLNIMLTQPARLLIAGAYDSMAKYIETSLRIQGKNQGEMLLGLDSSYLLSQKIYHDIQQLLPQALEALKNQTITEAFEKVIYTNLAVTGIISGIARGIGQSALAHDFYGSVRTLFTDEVSGFLHGELVGMALAVQLAYNGQNGEIPAFQNMLRTYSLPVRLKDIHISPTEKNLKLIYENMRASDTMRMEEKNGEKKLARALRQLV